MEIIKIIAMAVTGVVLASFMKPVNKEMSIYIIIATVILIFLSVAGTLTGIFDFLENIYSNVTYVRTFFPVIISAVTGFCFFMQHVVLPMVFLSAVFVMIYSITEKDYVKKLSSFIRKAAIFITGLLITIFSGITAIQGFVTKSADGILMNTAKFSIDNFVPIVGGFVADSLNMVISCIGLKKNAVGVAGIIIIVSLLTLPVIKDHHAKYRS